MTEDERRAFATIVARTWADQEFADRYRTFISSVGTLVPPLPPGWS